MKKQYNITEESLSKLQKYLGEIPHKYAKEIEGFLFNDKVLIEIKEEKGEKEIKENKDETTN